MKKIDPIVSLAKRRGFVFPGSEIYGGLANSWDYGPLGTALKNNLKKAWWDAFVACRRDVVGLDSAILMNAKTWEASGHLAGFSDPLMDCKSCKIRHRADKLLEKHLEKKGLVENVEGMTGEKLEEKIEYHRVTCPNCGKREFTGIRNFNLMFKTFQGATEESSSALYLRPETAQGVFVNFKNVLNASRKRIPFGIGQIGKSFRNEITPGNFIFRTREFEQMELEYFCEPEKSPETFDYWVDFSLAWLGEVGVSSELTGLRRHAQEELSHYSRATTDIEFDFPFGRGELWGIAHRGDFDLGIHQEFSGKDLGYFDPVLNRKYLPHVIEPSLGVDRLMLAVLCSAFEEDEIEGEKRTLLKLRPRVAPVRAAVLPLTKKIGEAAEKLADDLQRKFPIDYDETGSIGKRYRRQDEIGTPFCLTYDFRSLEDQTVTVRDRDTARQERIALDQVAEFLDERSQSEGPAT